MRVVMAETERHFVEITRPALDELGGSTKQPPDATVRNCSPTS